ncbi:hypothetical protein JCM17823_14990 [Halorubrum gandharaense]
METPEIERLDERTIQRIAAGEVVERPASVVKELVENSLDAGAERVSVSVDAGGTEGIRVRDDGVGIPPEQLEAAVAEHATSKIGSIEDLDAGVGTLGFRGEALYTVGAVSRLTVRSRPPGAEAGAEITVDGGDVGEVRPAGCPEGTTVEVDDLFFNTPARKKFLKRETTEFDHVNTVVTSYALANPDVAVSLEHNGRETFATEGNGDLRSAVLAVYGREVAESMVDVSWGSTDPASPVERVHGVVSHPETTRASRDYLATYVNERYVTASVLREAVIDAYGGQLAPDRYPFAVLFVEVPAGSVDVNVHPRKLEVRFDEERAVKSTVEDAVEAALLDHGLIRSTAPRGRSAPDETAVSPEAPDGEAVGGAGTAHERAGVGNRDAGGGSDGGGSDGGDSDDGEPATTTAAELDPDDEDAWTVGGLGGDAGDGAAADSPRFGNAEESGSGSGEDDDGELPGHSTARTGTERPSPREWQSDVDAADADSGAEPDDAESDSPADALPESGFAPTDDEEAERSEYGSDEGESGEDDVTAEEPAGTFSADSQPAADRSSTGSASAGSSSADASPTEEPSTGSPSDSVPSTRAPTATSQRTLGGDATDAERAFDSLPSLRVLGQLHDTYVVAEAPDGLVLVDQHAADERVNYERLKRTFADGADAQALASPVTVELTAREAALFEAFVDDLRELGFRAERAGEREVVVKAVPAVFDAALDPELLRDVLSAFVGDAADGSEPVEDVVDELLADLACYPSVTGNTSLTEGSVVDLLAALDDCENPYACPHGRPVVIAFDRADIEDRFERDYPGHAGRRAE